MKRLLPLLLLAAGYAPAADVLTLDPVLYAEALREAQANADRARAESAASAEFSQVPTAEEWQGAMLEAGTELGDVLLLALLHRLNPAEPPLLRAREYADVLRLHHLMQQGNPRACRVLARAFREGRFENGLLFLQHEGLSTLMEQRAAAFQLPSVPDSVPHI